MGWGSNGRLEPAKVHQCADPVLLSKPYNNYSRKGQHTVFFQTNRDQGYANMGETHCPLVEDSRSMLLSLVLCPPRKEGEGRG